MAADFIEFAIESAIYALFSNPRQKKEILAENENDEENRKGCFPACIFTQSGF